MNKKILIVNADDYGLTPSVSKGIRDGYKNGIITSTTIIMSGTSVEQDLILLKKECPNIGIGVHLTLTTFAALSKKSEVSSLLKNGANFYSLGELIENKNSINRNELYFEWKNQITALLNLGVEIDHLDSHHYVCFISKDTIEVTAQLAKEFNLSVRTPIPPIEDNEMVKYAYKYFDELNVVFPEFFIGDFTKQYGDIDILGKSISNLSDGVTELLTHAGLVDSVLKGLSSLVESRVTELASLKSQSIKELIIKNKIELSSFGKVFKLK